MWIMIAGPYGAAAGQAHRQRNLQLLNRAANAVLAKGHVPIVGVNAALPIIEAAGQQSYDRIMMPLSLSLAERCDAVLRIGGASAGADQEVDWFRRRGLRVFEQVQQIPEGDQSIDDLPPGPAAVDGGEVVAVRAATEADAMALLEIYRPHVESTAVSFEEVVPTVDEFSRRIERYGRHWAWLVAEHAGHCVGYAYGAAHRDRAAYRWSVEVSAYVAPGHQRQGVGTALYRELFVRLRDRGFCNAYAGITLPNRGSVALHTRTGFEPIGVFRRVGWKFGQWHDVAWFHRRLREAPEGE